MTERERLVPDRSEDLHRYAERDPTAITQNLRRMIDGRAPVAIFDGDGGSALGRAVMTLGQDLVVELDIEDLDSPVLGSPWLTVVALVHDVKVQFEVRGPLVPAVSPDRVLLPLPDRLHRLQRRGGFRVRPPTSDPSVLHLGQGGRPIRVLDVSVLGLGLWWPADTPMPWVGERWAGCRLRLGLQLLACDLVIRNTMPRSNGGGRVGCAFETMPREQERQLERAVMDLERRAILHRT